MGNGPSKVGLRGEDQELSFGHELFEISLCGGVQ